MLEKCAKHALIKHSVIQQFGEPATDMCMELTSTFSINCWPMKPRKEKPPPKEKRKPGKFRKKSLHEIPEISKMETISIWLQSNEPDDYQCDCFQPDSVHYACADVTEKFCKETINM